MFVIQKDITCQITGRVPQTVLGLETGTWPVPVFARKLAQFFFVIPNFVFSPNFDDWNLTK